MPSGKGNIVNSSNVSFNMSMTNASDNANTTSKTDQPEGSYGTLLVIVLIFVGAVAFLVQFKTQPEKAEDAQK